jgi:hypothetical protein
MIDGTRAALAVDMRTIETIQIHELALVTGGCKKQQPPPPPQPAPQAAPADPGPRVGVTVATGAQGGQAIQQALQSF